MLTNTGVQLGRPCKLEEPGFEENFVNALKKVRYIGLACDLMRINHQTVNSWRRIARKHEKELHADGSACNESCNPDMVRYRSFHLNIKNALAEIVSQDLEDIGIIAKRANKWEGLAWRLERTMPDKFGLKQRTDVNVKGNVNVNHQMLPLEQRKKILEAGNKALALESAQEKDDVIEAEVIPVQDES